MKPKAFYSLLLCFLLTLTAPLWVLGQEDAESAADSVSEALPEDGMDDIGNLSGMDLGNNGMDLFSGLDIPSDKKGMMGGGISIGRIDGDLYLIFDLITAFSFSQIGLTLGIQAPIRIRIKDNEPISGSTPRTKPEDWDEDSDWAKIVRFVEFKKKFGTIGVRARYGELTGEIIGHGSIMYNYTNGMEANHYQAGIASYIKTEYGGIEFMLNNLFNPEIWGARLAANPFAVSFGPENYLSRFGLGFSYISDFKAPKLLATDDDGNFKKTDEENLIVSETSKLDVFGVDAEFKLLDKKTIQLTPYIDFNTLLKVNNGNGLHIGTFLNFVFGTPIGPTVMSKLEYRFMNKGYIPTYFDGFYQIQRYQYITSDKDINGDGVEDELDNPPTKYGYAHREGISAQEWLGGFFGSAGLDFGGYLRVVGEYENRAGPNNSNLTFRLVIPKIPHVKLAGYYSKRNFESGREIFGPEFFENALAALQIRIELVKFLYLQGGVIRTWQVNESGDYEPVDDFDFGIGTAFHF